MEGHGLGLQCDSGGTRWLLVRRLLAKLNVTTAEVDIAGGRFRFVDTAIVHIKIILQFKLRYGLDLEEIHRERYTEKVAGCIFEKNPCNV